MTSKTTWELPYACKCNTPSRPGTGESNCTFQRQRHTFLFPTGFISLAEVRKIQPCKQAIVPACWAACPFWQASFTLQTEAFVKGRHVAEYSSSLAHILNGHSRIKHHVSFQGWVWYLPESSFLEKSWLWGFSCCFGACFLKEYHVHYSSPVTYLEAVCVTTCARWLIHFIILHWRTMVSYS